MLRIDTEVKHGLLQPAELATGHCSEQQAGGPISLSTVWAFTSAIFSLRYSAKSKSQLRPLIAMKRLRR